jgi:hypothetical protein
LPLPLRSSGGSCSSVRNAFNRPTTLGKPTQIGKLVREDCRNSSNMCPLWRIWLNRFQLCRTNSKEGVSHGKSSVSFAHLGGHMCRCGDRRHAGRKCSKQIRRHVDCCVSDKIWAVSASVPRRSTGGRRRHGGRGHNGFSHRTRVTQWLGKGHWVHGRELWRRLGTSVGQFRQWNVARSHAKRELRRCLERAATIISHLPPRGLVQTRTATSRCWHSLSRGRRSASMARTRSRNTMTAGI